MLDHARKWEPAPDWSTAVLNGKHLSVRNVDLPDQALVSGDLAAFGHLTGMDENGVGAFGHVKGLPYTVRLARDRLLVVGGLPSAIHDGWNEAGFAVTAIGGADRVIELSGAGVMDLVSQATTVDPALASASASIGFAAVPALAYHYGPASDLRLHVERGLAVSIWTWLQTVLSEEEDHDH
ncbi:sarcosine oxidase subunit gamma family protein [Rhizobium miluonense]|uniref:Sarcosine oxidase subunit gamma n=1 Tax=Rhizobium miluonense TaxID=411945 RepID=A0A1C3V7Q2_9HYPH|nr:sarcosine oxidase subunit gamma family protein [Rhizobium miluonense]SCB23763.1 hypothetical protein GA0061102_1009115 [Rhizobium miluonense]